MLKTDLYCEVSKDALGVCLCKENCIHKYLHHCNLLLDNELTFASDYFYSIWLMVYLSPIRIITRK